MSLLYKAIKKKILRFLANTSYPLYKWYWRTFNPKTFGARMVLIHKKSGDLLLTKNLNSPVWSFCGGGVKRGEDMRLAALREVEEELGISKNNVDVLYKLGTYTSVRQGKRDTTEIYVGETSQREIEMEWELDAAEWFSKDDLPENLSPATSRRIGEFKKEMRNIEGEW